MVGGFSLRKSITNKEVRIAKLLECNPKDIQLRLEEFLVRKPKSPQEQAT